MATGNSPERHSESGIGIFIILVIVFIAAAVVQRQGRYDLARFGIVAGSAQTAKVQSPVPEKQEPGLSFAALAAGRVVTSSGVETYNADTLYEKIDGKAPLYVESGFKQLNCQRFAASDDAELGFELYLYDMGNTKNAFSVYSRQKRLDATDISDMQFTYATTNGVYLSYAKYYAEFVGSAESEELVAIVAGAARKLTQMLASDAGDTAVAELQFFQQQGVVPGSAKLHLANAFGYEGLSNTFTSLYSIEGQQVTLFFSRCSNAQDARQAADKYCQFLISNAAKEIAPVADLPQGARIFDFYGTIEVVAVSGPFLAGVHEADNKELAVKAARTFIDHLNQTASDKK